MADTAPDTTDSAPANPWPSSLATTQDPLHAQAIQGFVKGVQNNLVEPEDGLDRLKKIGAVHPDTSVSDLLPGYSASGLRSSQNPLMQNQLKGIGNLQNLLKMETQNKSDQALGMGVNLTPLNKLADFENAKDGIHTDNNEGYQTPQSPDQQNTQNFTKQQALLKDQSDIMKGQHSQQMFDQQDWNSAQRFNSKNIEGIKNDQMLKTQTLGLNSIKNAEDLFRKNPSTTTFNELQQAIRLGSTGLMGGAKSSYEERAGDYFNNIDIVGKQAKQFFGNGVEKMDANSPVAQQILNESKNLRTDVGNDAARQAIVRAGGYDYIYDNPIYGDKLKQGLTNYIQGRVNEGRAKAPPTTYGAGVNMGGQTAAPPAPAQALPPGPAPQSPADMPPPRAPAAAPQTMVKNGHTYVKVQGGWKLQKPEAQ